MAFFKYPLQIKILILAAFILGFDFMGAILIPFFKDWGGLSQFQIQTLQSWFSLWIFFLEIPTGLIGDVKGRKFSVLVGLGILIFAPILYGSIPMFLVFLIAEFLYALALAFTSGSDEALLYDSTKELKIEHKFKEIQSYKENMHLVGMLAGALITGILVKFLPLNLIFQLQAITSLIAFLLIFKFVREPKLEVEGFVPNYKEIAKKSFRNLKNNPVLKRIVIFITIISSTTYFVIWFNQLLLKNINIADEYFGYFRFFLVISQIIMTFIFIKILGKIKKDGLFLTFGAVLIVIGFVAGALMNNIFGVLLFLILAGGIGLRYRVIFSSYINEFIESSERATTLSFISMIRRFAIAGLNPLIGFLADIRLSMTILILAGIVMIGTIFYFPKYKTVEVKR